MQVIDSILAEQIEVNDLIRIVDSDGIEADTLTVNRVVDDGDHIVVHGESLVEGDSVQYLLEVDQFVDLMGA